MWYEGATCDTFDDVSYWFRASSDECLRPGEGGGIGCELDRTCPGELPRFGLGVVKKLHEPRSRTRRNSRASEREGLTAQFQVEGVRPCSFGSCSPGAVECQSSA